MTTAFSDADLSVLDPSLLTPAMRQYQQYKAQYPNAVLFFRIGDFYETFYEDARTAARVLGVALTSRSKQENAVPMAGVPYHAVDTYLQRMVAAGYKVAICEQIEDARNAKGVVKREVVRLVTPGTLTEESMLDGREENFVACLILAEAAAGSASHSEPHAARKTQAEGAIAWCELSTGKFLTMAGSLAACSEELARLRPRELLYPETADGQAPAPAARLAESLGLALSPRPAWQAQPHQAAAALKEHYGVLGFAGFGYTTEKHLGLAAAGLVVAYLHETQKAALEHIQPPREFDRQNHLIVDPVSLRSLEVLKTIRGNSSHGSLSDSLDETVTAMGARLLRNYLCFPLRDLKAIAARHDAVAAFLDQQQALEQLRLALRECADVERIAGRLCCRRAGPRDLAALARSLEAMSAAAGPLAGLEKTLPVVQEFLERLPVVREVARQIRAAVADPAPAHTRQTGFIRAEFNSELDRLRALSTDSRAFLAKYQSDLIASTGISSLKVGYNKVFGFYIEVTHAHGSRVPATFTRKQTVRNAERYITPELKQYETDLLTAQERALALEQDIFEQLRGALAAHVQDLQRVASATAALDVLAAFAHVARQRHFCRPVMTTARALHLIDARHPVLEPAMGEKFVPNDLEFLDGGPTLHLITGPNMAGKSTFIRQAALVVLMAQAGSFVPAREATIGLTDRIFTRVGASDDLAAGQSTFMVEMTETAHILLHASDRSLVILDEIGRGTSTLDGLALAWAIAEFLTDTAGCRTLFATHYHELTELAESSKAVANYNVLVREWEDQVIFLHRIVAGQADKSYGVQVARLAGVPRSVVQRARQLLGELRVQVGKARPRAAATAVNGQVQLFDSRNQQALARLASLDLDRMSPMQAWEALQALRQLVEGKT